ncbi:MAG: AraC family transcriptional regulator [Akkermansiaceae bacterium]|nr:AraC family transcriptional regulator [Akkermansiaceae bacterium]NNM28924.1 AraC family transcriptional regulator [Akkermansiaceae bacterium]
MASAFDSNHPDDLNLFSDFVQSLQPGQIALGLFQALPDVLFWIKDLQSRFVFVNRAFSDLLGITPESFVGRTDGDIFAPELAQAYLVDDERVRDTGQPLLNKMELVTRRAGGIEWRMTSKIPLRDRGGYLIGTAGISRRLDQHEGQPLPAQYRSLSKLVDFVHEHVNQHLSVEELARQAGMSISTLERRFRTHLGTSPKRFILHAKIAAACDRLLNTPMSVGEISESLGYHEHASFTRAFTSVMHMAPTSYRKHYLAGS